MRLHMPDEALNCPHTSGPGACVPPQQRRTTLSYEAIRAPDCQHTQPLAAPCARTKLRLHF